MPIPYKIVSRLEGIVVDNPIELNEVSIQLDLEKSSKANIETDSYTFVNEAFTIIKEHIASGLNGGVGILEGIPFDISIQTNTESLKIFEGYLDPNSYQDLSIDEPKIIMKAIEIDGLQTVFDRLEGLTFALLEANGTIKSSDYKQVQYIVEKKVTFVEQALLALSIYLMLKEVYEAALRLQENVATIISIASSSLTGQVGALIYAIASAIFEAAYIVLMLSALKDLVIQFQENLLPLEKKYNAINLRTGLTKIFEYLGYNFESTIPDLDTYTYLPSKADGRQDKGVPFDSDYGFQASEFVELCNKMFYSKLIIGKDSVKMVLDSDAILQNESTFIMPSVIEKPFTYNTNEIKESTYIAFQEDISDEYTVSNWKGTSFVITTKPITVNNPKNVNILGFDEIRQNVALGSRKTELTDLENALNSFFKAVGFLFSTFGDNSTEKLISNRIGFLKISNQFFNIPKILKVNSSGKLTNDSRTGLSAKYLWENYINQKSFVENNYKKQRKIQEGVTIPFNFLNYKQIINNSYFTDSQGKKGKILDLLWNIDKDTAEIDYYIEEIYTKNLKEEFYETE